MKPKWAVWMAISASVLLSGVALGQDPAQQGDAYMKSERFWLAGEAYQKAYDITKERTYLRKSGAAFIRVGSAGRENCRPWIPHRPSRRRLRQGRNTRT